MMVEGKSPGARQQNGSERRRIAEAIVDLVATQGYGATSVESLCRRAAVEPEAFRHHFPSLDECFRQVWEEIADGYLRLSIEAWERHAGWRDSVRAVVEFTVACAQEDPKRARFLIVEGTEGGEVVQARRDDVMRRFTDLVDAGRELPNATAASRATAEAV